MENQGTGKKRKLMILLFALGVIAGVGIYFKLNTPDAPVALAGYGNVLFGIELEYPMNMRLSSPSPEVIEAESVGVVRDVFTGEEGQMLAIGSRKSGEASTGKIADAVPEMNTQEAFDSRIRRAKKYVNPNKVEVYIFGSRKSGIWGGETVREANLVSPNSNFPYVTISAKDISKDAFMQIINSITTDK